MTDCSPNDWTMIVGWSRGETREDKDPLQQMYLLSYEPK